MPKLNSRRTRDERHAAMAAAADNITKNEKLEQDAKTERLRKLREDRDAATNSANPQAGKKPKTSRPIPAGSMSKRAGTEMLVSRACARIREETSVEPPPHKRSGMWSQVVSLRSEFSELTDDEIINVVVSDYEP